MWECFCSLHWGHLITSWWPTKWRMKQTRRLWTRRPSFNSWRRKTSKSRWVCPRFSRIPPNTTAERVRDTCLLPIVRQSPTRTKCFMVSARQPRFLNSTSICSKCRTPATAVEMKMAPSPRWPGNVRTPTKAHCERAGFDRRVTDTLSLFLISGIEDGCMWSQHNLLVLKTKSLGWSQISFLFSRTKCRLMYGTWNRLRNRSRSYYHSWWTFFWLLVWLDLIRISPVIVIIAPYYCYYILH